MLQAYADGVNQPGWPRVTSLPPKYAELLELTTARPWDVRSTRS